MMFIVYIVHNIYGHTSTVLHSRKYLFEPFDFVNEEMVLYWSFKC